MCQPEYRGAIRRLTDPQPHHPASARFCARVTGEHVPCAQDPRHCAESVQAAPTASFGVQTRLAGSQVLASSHTAGMHACPDDTIALHVPSLRQTRDAHASANVQGVDAESNVTQARVDGSQ